MATIVWRDLLVRNLGSTLLNFSAKKRHTRSASLGVALGSITEAFDGVSCTVASQHASSPAAVRLHPAKGKHSHLGRSGVHSGTDAHHTDREMKGCTLV